MTLDIIRNIINIGSPKQEVAAGNLSLYSRERREHKMSPIFNHELPCPSEEKSCEHRPMPCERKNRKKERENWDNMKKGKWQMMLKGYIRSNHLHITKQEQNHFRSEKE